ncbi:nucleoid-associated protein [Motiliproteus sp. MSK22-1]|uniref:nucleoid-associated protein n=1 Tax=Motiliproteus sp. MSK22-1 TaxID=1897630 RepID=UPI000976969A|nr:nucleoid-associated protein [Motiliproteus sp. MSK22-1]OMH38018.1 hypothetical protein BGP75_06960 [Motiliproteus sp. MSK22-1]
MATKEAIVHFIEKPEGGEAKISPRQSLLTNNPSLDDLISKVSAAYNKRAGKIYGGFEEDGQEYPFGGWLKSYVDGELDLLQFGNATLTRFKQMLDEQTEAFSGYLLFARQEVLEVDQLLLLVLSTSPAVIIDDQLELNEAHHLELGKVQLGAKVNLDEWSKGTGTQFISFVKSRSGKEISESFRRCIGSTEEVDSKAQTQTLLKVFNDYCSDADLPSGQASAVKQKAYEYCNEQVESGNRVHLQELSCVMDTSDPDKFYNYASEQEVDLKSEIPADRGGLKKFVRYSGSMKGMSLSFSEMLLGEQILYDADTDTLTIRGVPPTLKKQLSRNKS